MKTIYTAIVQFSLILLSILISSTLVVGQDSEREIQRQTYERSILGKFQSTNFKDIPWMMIFSDGRLSYPEVKKLFEQKVASIDLVVEDRKLHKKWHIYQNMMEARQYADGKFHFQDDRLAAIRKYERVKALEKSAAANFQFIGQDSSVLYTNNGRIERVNFHPSDPNIIWASAPEGGLWRSNDAGATWNIIDENWEHLSVGDLVYNAHDNDTVYVATDDHDSWFNANRGVLRSDDGGVTWAVVGLPNSQATNVYKLMMHPDGRTLYACTSQGLFTSSDHGVTWIHNTALPINVNDLEFHPTNPMIIYATTRATFIPSTFDYFFVSTNGGTTFTQMTAPIDAIAGTTQVTVSPNNPDIAYIAAYPGGQADPKQGGKVMKYTQSTNTITIVTPVTYTFPMPYWSLAGAWDFRIEVDPNDANHLLHGCVWTHESFDGGATWNLTSVPHADVHDIKWQAGTNRLWVAEDGGLSYTTDNGSTWNTMRKLPVMQWYSVSSSKYGTVKLMGAQDAGVHVDYDGHWFRPGGGDGLEVKVDPVDSTLMYGTVQQGLNLYQIRYDPNTQTHARVGLINQTSGGGQATWRQEVLIDAADRNILYTNYLDIFKSTDRGATWTNITNGNLGNNGAQIKYIYQPKSSPNILITGWDNQMKKSTDAGITWNSITHPGIYLSDQTQMVIHPSNPDLMWACGSGRVRKTTDGGTTWTEYTGTLSPALGIGTTIAYQDGTNDLLYVGGKYGNIYYRDNTMSDWTMHRTNMPNVWVQEIEVLPLIDKMRVATWGRGVWESPTAAPSMMPCNEPASPSISVQQCGVNADLTIAAAPSGYTIAWYKDDVVIASETSTMLSVTMNGVYKARYLETAGTCHSFMSEAVNINFNAAVTLNTGRGINFDGTDDYISTTNGAIDLSGKSFSIEFWAKPATSGNTDYVIGQGGVGTNVSLHVGFRSSGEFTFAFYSNDLNADAKYKDQNWHHWACVYDKSIADPAHNRFIYRDGVLVASDRSTSDFLGSGVLNIGTQLGSYFNGTLDDVKIWYKALNQTEVQANIYCPLTCYDENLALYIPINEGIVNADNTGLTITDYSVNSHTLTLNNLSLNGTSSNIVNGLNLEISGATTVCSGLNWHYSAPDIHGATSYTWSLPNGWTGSSITNEITLVPSSSNGTITCTVATACGNQVFTKAVIVKTNCDAAIDFDGTDDYIDLEDDVYFDGGSFTIEAWVYSKVVGNWTYLMDFGNGAGDENVFFALSNGTSGKPELRVYGSGGGKSGVISDKILPLNQWVHLAGTYDSNSGATVIYMNGEIVASGTITETPPNIRRTRNYIGKSNWTNEDHTTGAIDEFRIWNVARTQAEIETSMFCNMSNPPSSVVAYLSFEDGVPNTDNSGVSVIHDNSSNERIATVNNLALSGTTSNFSPTVNVTRYADADIDEYGDPNNSTTDFCATGNYSLVAGDCNDNDANINPYATEVCGNSVDDNCDGNTDQEVNKGLHFNGSGHKISIPNIVYSTNFSYETWVKVEEVDQGTTYNLIQWGGGTTTATFAVHSGGGMAYYEGGGFSFGPDVVDGQWHHLVIVREGLNIKVYSDGVQRFSNSNLNNPINNTYINIGDGFKGQMDDLRYWDVALTAAQIQERMNSRLNGNEANLIRYYPLDHGVPNMDNSLYTIAKDWTSNTADGTLIGFGLTGATSNWVTTRSYPTLYLDDDNDGFGSSTTWTCGSMDDYVENNLDCDDSDANINPLASEICGNSKDDNCDGMTDADDNTALNFDDATSNFLSIPVVDYTDDFAVEYWFKSETNSGGIKNIVRYEGATENWELGIWDNELGFLTNNNGWRFGGTVNDGQWHRLVMNYRTSDDNVKIYLDGQLKLNVSRNMDFEATAMAIGSTTGGGLKWKGTLDEFRIWDRLLTDSEIADTELIRLEGNETGLLRYYPFDHGVASANNAGVTTVRDGHTAAQHGTMTGFTLTGNTSNWVAGQNYTPLYFDEDQDGFGGTTLWTCGSTVNYTLDNLDTDDNDNMINPAALDICGTGMDENGNGVNDENTLSLKFDGSDDYIDLGNTLGNFGTGDFTIEARFKTTGTRDAIIAKRGVCSCDNFWNILVDTGGEMTFEIYNESGGGCVNGTTLISTTLVNDGNWHHVAVTRKNSVVRLFVDGVQERMGTATADINTTYPLEIGKSVCNFDNFFLNGEIDEVRLWNYARGSSSIAAFKNAVVPASMTGLLAYYDFNNPSAASGQDNTGQTTLTDGTGNYNGTLTNFALNGTSSNWVGNPEVTKTWYADTDMDGYGDINVTQVACTQPAGYVENSDDCNDNDANISPAATEILGNSIDDDCDGATDETSAVKWIPIANGSNTGSCTSNTNCCTQTFCYGLELTPASTGTITSYTTGFFVDCVGGNSPVLSNSSCTMDDSSNAINGCATEGKVLFNSSGNNGNLSVTAGSPVILHQVCFSISNGSSISIEKDEITNITISNQGTTSFNNEFPAFVSQSLLGNQDPVLTATTIDACYMSVAAAEAAAIAATTATDDCPTAVVLTASTSGTCSAVITVTGTDECGLTSSVTYNTRIDGDAPTVTGSTTASTVEGCDASVTPSAATDVAGIEALGTGLDIADACSADNALTVTHSDASNGTCPLIITRTYTIKDECNNEVTIDHIININDTTAPTVTGSTTASTFEGCDASAAPSAATDIAGIEALGTGLDIADACSADNTLTVTHSDASSGTCPLIITRTYTIKDECNNEVTVDHIININDTTAPTVTGSTTANTIEGCDASAAPSAATDIAGIEALGTGLDIVDACSADNALTVTHSDASNGTCPLIITRTYTIKDECNNEVTVDHIININDTTAPTVTGSTTANTIEGCDASAAPSAATDIAGIEALGTGLDIADACSADNALTVTHSDASSGTCPLIITRTYTIKDECNNEVTVDHIININDTTAPTVTGSTTASTLEGCDASAAPNAATDIAGVEALGTGLDIADACSVDNALTVTHSDASSGTCPLIITRTYTIKDECNNEVTVDHIININDTTNPVVTQSGSIAACYETVAAAEAAAIAATTASDDCTTTVGLTAGTAGTCSAVITVTGTDNCGNMASVTYNTSITNSILPMEQGGSVSNSSTIYNILDAVTPTTLPVFEDACGNTLSPTGPVQGGTHMTGDCDGTITFTYTYTDCAGVSADWVYTYTLECSPLDMKVFLEGAYSSMGDSMVTTINNNHLLPGQDKNLSSSFSIRNFGVHTPFGQPYSAMPWSYTGNTGNTFGDTSAPGAPANVTNYPEGVVDWILVTVRENGTSDQENIWTCAGWVYKDGSVGFPDNCGTLTINTANTYYILVQHRNHLGIMGQATISTAGDRLEMNFTTQNSIASIFRKGQKEVETGVWAMFSSNGEQEASRPSINSADRTTWGQLQNKIGYYLGDYDLNAVTNSIDETLWKNNQNTTTGVDLDND